MANFVFTAARKEILASSINYLTDDIRAVLMSGSPPADSAANPTLADITVPVGLTAVALSSKTVVAGTYSGIARAANTVLTGTPGSGSYLGLVVYKHTGTASTSRLIAYMDRKAGDVILGGDFNGFDITLAWPSGDVFYI